MSSSYLANIGRVVWAENTDGNKKSRQGREPATAWFPALIVAPSASGQVKIDTKDDYLIRSFKDGRWVIDFNLNVPFPAWAVQGDNSGW